MSINLTNSYRDRQKILNNPYLLKKIEEHFNFKERYWYDRLTYKNNSVITKQQLLSLLDTNESVIKKYIVSYSKELKASGYILLKGKCLQDFLSICDSEILYNNIYSYDSEDRNRPITTIDIFPFKAWLNLAMLKSKSEKAKFVRSRILDIAIDIAAEKEGGRVRYINRQYNIRFLNQVV